MKRRYLQVKQSPAVVIPVKKEPLTIIYVWLAVPLLKAFTVIYFLTKESLCLIPPAFPAVQSWQTASSCRIYQMQFPAGYRLPLGWR